jgi:heme/copper-type cytochrome/quinol oxidase subunit 2
MESNTTLFSLTIDPTTKANLSEAARWARFLAIVGFVFLGMIVVFGFFVSAMVSRVGMVDDGTGLGAVAGFAGIGMAIMYIIVALIWFFPLLFTYRFAGQMRGALNSNDQELLNSSFLNLKSTFRYLGVITIISLVFLALSLIFGVAGLALI